MERPQDGLQSREISLDASWRDSVLECASVLALSGWQLRWVTKSAKTLAHSKTLSRTTTILFGPNAKLP
jgi:hypothetical protein